MLIKNKSDVPEPLYRAMGGRLHLCSIFLQLKEKAVQLNYPHPTAWAWLEFKKKYIKDPVTGQWTKKL